LKILGALVNQTDNANSNVRHVFGLCVTIKNVCYLRNAEMKAFCSKTMPVSMLGLGWYSLHHFDAVKYQQIAYDKGRSLTLKYHNYPGWEQIVEPMIIRQINLLFSVGNSFVQGLKSDNLKQDKD
jgi:hypothetical protein